MDEILQSSIELSIRLSLNYINTFQNNQEKCLNKPTYHQTSNISHSLVGHKIVDDSDVAGASPVGSAPTTSTFST